MDNQQDRNDDDDSFTVCYMDQSATRPIHVEDGKPFDLEVDTVAALSILSAKDLHIGENSSHGKVASLCAIWAATEVTYLLCGEGRWSLLASWATPVSKAYV